MDDSPVIVFDADCGICSTGVRAMQRLDRANAFRYEPYQTKTDEELAKLGLTRRRCEGAAQLITSRGRVFGGVFALNGFLWTRWWGKPIVTVTYLVFPILLVEIGAYALVVRNRYRISKWLGLQACRIDYRH
ncbi:MAG: DUF393 domain-containing protein [Fimbriimonas ginsengisoli]|uniref:DUF393 domain-containing protein n=1 Tax=Fimbriimonas ginsengisoli TaxID=1005039 RepID=A0A931LV37_FIMGI|nr:DUF393 domain-containing protein [Fimbriimonas ginsengisoli]